MKDILLRHGDQFIECDINDLELTYTYSFDPKAHYVHTLRDRDSYGGLKRMLTDIYNESECKDDGYEYACELLQTTECDKFFVGMGRIYFDIRSRAEINKYELEASEKVWLMRSCHISSREPIHEVARPTMERILNTYKDIPEDGYDTWECGYWNGIMGALRWVLGDEKDFLDT